MEKVMVSLIKKKNIFALLFLFLFTSMYAVEKDINLELMFFLPTIKGHICGNNSTFDKMQDSTKVDNCYTFDIEERGDICSVNNFSFCWGFGMGGYVEDNIDKSSNNTAIQASLGGGVLYNFSWCKYSLEGVGIFFQPIYLIPIYSRGKKPELEWKMSVDLGYTFVFWDYYLLYPFSRVIFGWNKASVKADVDFGVAIGLFSPRKY